MYVKVVNNQAQYYTLDNLFKDYPNVSFPSNITDDILADYNIYKLKKVDAPAYNPLIQTIVKTSPILINNEWTETWIVEDLPHDIQIQKLKNARQKAFVNEADRLFFKAQRGEIDMSVWEAKVQEIRERFPYPQQ